MNAFEIEISVMSDLLIETALYLINNLDSFQPRQRPLGSNNYCTNTYHCKTFIQYL